MLKLVVVLGAQVGLLDAGSNTGAMLNFWGDAAFYFMPVFVGGFAAKKFGANTGLGMMLGAALIYPDFVALVGEGTKITLFGLPVYGATYTSTLLPAVLCVWVMSYVEKFFAKHSPAALRAMLEPFCTMLVMVPLSMWVLAPVATMVGNVIGVGLNWLTGSFGFIGMAVIGALWPLLIVAGMHVGLLPFVFQQLSSAGYMTINIPNFTNNFAQGAACLGVAVRTRDENLRAQSITCAIKEGQRVHTGDLLISCDLAFIKEKGYNTITPVLVTNADEYESVDVLGSGAVKAGDALLRAK